jgi:nucleoporin NUP82
MPNDIYLTYSIFILTSTMRIISFALNLRADSPSHHTKQLPSHDDQDNTDEWVVPVEGPSAYISLLESEPYVIPPILSRPFGLPSNPRLALPESQNTQFMLTPDMLRHLGSIVERFLTEIHEILLAFRAADARSDLHRMEFTRQQDLWRAMTEAMEKLKGPGNTKTQESLKRVQDGQRALLTRCDRIVQSLMEKASPDLSEHETKWFEELRRMKDEIAGAGRYDEWSLVARTEQARSYFLCSCDKILTIQTIPAAPGICSNTSKLEGDD